MRRTRNAFCVCLLVLTAACGGRRPSLPTGTGSPFPDFSAAYSAAVEGCRDVRTALVELGLSGRAGSTRLRGRINTGLAIPAGIRLEGVAFGRQIFILAGRDGRATLLLTREDRVIRDAPPEAIIEALAGVAVTPSELLAAVAGCAFGAVVPQNGRLLGNDWAAIDGPGSVTYLRRVAGQWRVAGAVRGPLTMIYDEIENAGPQTIIMRSIPPGSEERPVADITLRVSDLEINTTIDPRAFEVNVPPDADPLTVEELRRAGPLGERR